MPIKFTLGEAKRELTREAKREPGKEAKVEAKEPTHEHVTHIYFDDGCLKGNSRENKYDLAQISSDIYNVSGHPKPRHMLIKGIAKCEEKEAYDVVIISEEPPHGMISKKIRITKVSPTVASVSSRAERREMDRLFNPDSEAAADARVLADLLLAGDSDTDFHAVTAHDLLEYRELPYPMEADDSEVKEEREKPEYKECLAYIKNGIGYLGRYLNGEIAKDLSKEAKEDRLTAERLTAILDAKGEERLNLINGLKNYRHKFAIRASAFLHYLHYQLIFEKKPRYSKLPKPILGDDFSLVTSLYKWANPQLRFDTNDPS